MTKQTDNTDLLRDVKIGDLTFKNRVFMAPLTRARSDKDGHTQTPLHALYYAQRASAGLIISEATQISQEGQGYAWTPGIFTDAQVKSWQVVNNAIHNAGGHIFCQLWHVGAISHRVFQPDHNQPVSSSVWTPKGEAFVGDYLEDGPTVPHAEARALSKTEIKRLIDDYKHAAQSAKDASFDGVELHAANGYLIDQFMRDSVNKRDDEYGGSIENRLRLLNEIIDALLEVLPAQRIGVRLSPTGGPGGSYDSAPEALYLAAAKALSGKGLAYIHVIRPNNHTGDGSNKEGMGSLMDKMREAFDGAFIANGEFTPDEANQWIKSKRADAIAFGRPYIANPDLVERIASNAALNAPDAATFYGGQYEGYTDYPSLKKTQNAL
jgi:N-ethylmaleimide reductase